MNERVREALTNVIAGSQQHLARLYDEFQNTKQAALNAKVKYEAHKAVVEALETHLGETDAPVIPQG